MIEQTENKPRSFLKAEVTLGQLLGFALTLASIFFTHYVSVSIDLSVMKNQMQNLKMMQDEKNRTFNENQTVIMEKLTSISERVGDLRVDVAKIQDKTESLKYKNHE
ncbi:MAG: hypothetical protein IPK66_18600 [Rhodospirillales bacterium]|nr:hypothetical protein [Rhodospirillales bacterium]